MPDNSGAIDLGSLSADEQQRVLRMADDNPEPAAQDEKSAPEVLYAFGVVVGRDGNPQIVEYPETDDFVQLVPLSTDLIYGAVSIILKDLNSQETAHAAASFTIQGMQQQAIAMREQMEAQRVAAQLDLSGVRG